jgi:hypothetical protein
MFPSMQSQHRRLYTTNVFRHLLLLFCCGILLSSIAFGQTSDFHRHNVTAGVGPAIPTGGDTSYLSPAPFVSVGYGYRFSRFLQADVGFQATFGAANNPFTEVTDLGNIKGGDREYFIPFGGRVIIPTPFNRIEVSAGGGGVHLHYSETVPSSYYYQNNCYSCASRGGWGAYGLANISYFLDDNHTFHVGTTGEFVSAKLNGESVGATPANSSTDHWMNISFEFGIGF